MNINKKGSGLFWIPISLQSFHQTVSRHKKTGNELFSQGQAQLSSPRKCLTSVFGMGTGVSTSLSSPDFHLWENVLSKPNNRSTIFQLRASFRNHLRSSPRPISISPLHISLCFHSWPIYLVTFKGTYYFRMGDLILKPVSRLDAFSVYPIHS